MGPPLSMKPRNGQKTIVLSALVLLIVQIVCTLSSANAEPLEETSRSIDMSDVKSVCGRNMWQQPNGRIVGGTETKFAEWPWMISILEEYSPGEFSPICGASLLNENWAITAAHCVNNITASQLNLRFGDHDLANDHEAMTFEDRGVKNFIIHPEFDNVTLINDIALLRLDVPIAFQPHIIPVCLPEEDKTYVGEIAHATGWGATAFKGYGTDVMLKVQLPVLTNAECYRLYRKSRVRINFSYKFICAGLEKGTVSTCQGDSGGPLVVKENGRYVIIGITSWAIGCGEANRPPVYVRVSAYRDWINHIISQ